MGTTAHSKMSLSVGLINTSPKTRVGGTTLTWSRQQGVTSRTYGQG